jgi:protoheme IX farnesyltransferase
LSLGLRRPSSRSSPARSAKERRTTACSPALPPLAAIAVAAWLRTGNSSERWPRSSSARRRWSPRRLHLALAGGALAAAVVLAALVHRTSSALLGSARDYVALTKPRIMVLLLLTGFCGLVAGAAGLPPWDITVAAMLGLALACGGASAINHVMDRDIDRLMGSRTRRRPVAAERVPPGHALEFGLALSALSFTLLAGAVNPLTATLALVGNLFYVFVYTGWLKRSTPQNIVIGGAAAVAALVGWAAATGSLAPPAIALFLIVFLWTPPHFWALALLIKRDYAAAGVPMLPVVRGDRETTKQIAHLGLIVFTVVPFAAGWFALYLVAHAVYACSSRMQCGCACGRRQRTRRGLPLPGCTWRCSSSPSPRPGDYVMDPELHREHRPPGCSAWLALP